MGKLKLTISEGLVAVTKPLETEKLVAGTKTRAELMELDIVKASFKLLAILLLLLILQFAFSLL